MKTKTITVTNFRRRRKFGWDFSTNPTGEDAYSIESPEHPHYVGTIRQVLKSIAEDRVYSSLGGVYYSTRWFYDGRPIVGLMYGNDQVPFGRWIDTILFDRDKDIVIVVEERKRKRKLTDSIRQFLPRKGEQK